MELAIAFLHACPTASLSDADLHFLLETSGISLDMELIPEMDAEDLHLLRGFSYKFLITVCRDRVNESRCTLRQLALCLVAIEFPLKTSQQQLLLSRRFECLLNPPGTRSELVWENASLSPLSCLFERIAKTERRFLDGGYRHVACTTPLNLGPAIEVLTQAGEWPPLGKASKKKMVFVLEKFWIASSNLVWVNGEEGERWGNSVIEGMPDEVRAMLVSEEMRDIIVRFEV